MAKLDKLPLEVGRVYAQAERDVISRIANRLQKGRSLDIKEWEVQKLRELQTMRSGIEKQIVAKLDNYNDKEIQGIIKELYTDGSKMATADLNKVKDDVVTAFNQADKQTIANYTKALNNSLSSTHLRIVRQADDVYRRAVSEGVNTVLTGTGNRIEGAQKVVNEFANKGVSGFIDDAGRSWNLNTYAEMATRTTSQQARIDGAMNRFSQNGEDLVMVSAHMESCPLCDPWEGRILSISGKSNDYPSVSTARNAGLFHPNCGHNLTLYVEGLSEPPEPQPGGENYENRQQQRYNERNIRKWKRREAGAMTDKEKLKAKNKVKEWQQRQRDFIDEADRRRKYSREQVDQAR